MTSFEDRRITQNGSLPTFNVPDDSGRKRAAATPVQRATRRRPTAPPNILKISRAAFVARCSRQQPTAALYFAASLSSSVAELFCFAWGVSAEHKRSAGNLE
jgi:hypothetical protein